MGCPKITYDYQEEGLEKSSVHFFGQLAQKRGQQKNRINYYPFGLTMNGAVNQPNTQNPTPNTRLFNAGSELQELSNLYDTYYRQYDASLGRFNAIDPKATSFTSTTPYNFAFNDPVALNDPMGDCPDCWWEFGADGASRPMTTAQHIRYQGDSYLTNRSGLVNNYQGFAREILIDNAEKVRNREMTLDDYGAMYDISNSSDNGLENYSYADVAFHYSQLLGINLYSDEVGNLFKAGIAASETLINGKVIGYNFYQFSDELGVNVNDLHQQSGGLSTYTAYDQLIDGPLYDHEGNRVVAHTSLSFRQSNYSDQGVNFVFDRTYDNIMKSPEFMKRNGEQYYVAVEFHEQGHINQFMDIVNSSSFSFNGTTGTFTDILFNSGLSGDAYDDLFFNMMDHANNLWIQQNLNDPGHSDANRRARSMMPKHLRKYTYRPPKF